MSVLDAIGDYLEGIVYDSVRKAMIEVAPKQNTEEELTFVSVKEAGEYLGIKTTAIYERLKLPEVRSKKEDGRRKVCLNDLKRLKESNAIGRYARYKGKK